MKVLIWNNYDEWINTVKSIIIKLWGSKVLHKIKNYDIYPLIGNDDWISNLINSKKIEPTPFLDFSKEVANHWSHVRVYHACRTHSIENYCLNGIVSPSIQKLDQHVNDILKMYATEDEIELLLKYIHMSYDKSDEKVFVAFDKKHLREYCWHHLFYGSEYVLCCAMLLGILTKKQKDILIHIGAVTGTPTIVSCDIPIKKVPSDILYEIGAILLSEACRIFKDSTYVPFSRRLGFGISDIRPDWIVDYENIQDIKPDGFLPPVWMDIAKFERYINSVRKK